MVSSVPNVPKVAAKPTIPEPPKRLKAAGRKFWTAVHLDFVLESHQEPLLVAACVQLDRASQAARRYRLAKSERAKERALAGERAAQRAFLMARRELGLDSAPREQRGPRLGAGGRY